MPLALDLTGQRFGKLVALSKAKSKKGKTYWLCQCDCGQQKEIQTTHLRDGRAQSCGNCNNVKIKENENINSTTKTRRNTKIALVEAFHHRCAYCGLQDEPCIYDFHHLIPENKDFGLSAGISKSRQSILQEAKKCVMLCANCHRKIENNLITNQDLDIIPIDENIFWNTLNSL